MSNVKDSFKSAVLWHMNGCNVTFYESENQDAKKKKPIDTICFSNKANLANRNVNCLRIASPAVPYLEHLTILRLQYNNLKVLPNELWRLTSLQELNVGYNQLDDLPIEIGLLCNLRELYLYNNNLTCIPFQIGNLELSVLDITGNKLRTVPSNIFKPQLTSFWFDSNEFDDAIITTVNNLKFISLKNICKQTIGLLCASDEDAQKVIEESSDDFFVDKSTLLAKEPQLLIACANCHYLLYQPGLEVIEPSDYNNEKLVLSYKVCSQTCYIQLFTRRQ